MVTHLAAAFGVKRGGVEHHHAHLVGTQFRHGHAVHIQRGHRGLRLQVLVTHEGIAHAGVFQGAVHLEFAGCAGLRFLTVHGGSEAGFVHRQATFAADIARQIERKTIGVVQLESHVARQYFDAASQGSIQNLHAVFKRFIKPLFLGFQHRHDALGLLRQAGVGLAHEGHQVGHQLVEKRCFLTQLVTMANGAADDAPLHIAAAFVAGDDAVAHQKRGGTDVVGNHAQRAVVQVGAAGFARSRFDERVEQINLIVAVHMLQDGGQPLQAHACVHARCGQFFQGAIGLHVELHEHVVPNFNVAVAVFIGAAGRTACHFGAMVVKNLRAGAAGAGIGHHPEIVGGVFRAFVVADAHDALGGNADFLVPNVIGLVVVDVDRDPQFVGGQLVNLGQQLPAPFQAVALEVVAKRPVAQHLEEGVVTRGVAHVFQVVVLAASAQTGLNGRSAHIRAFVFAQKHVFELHHAGVGEHQRRVVAGHQGAGGHHGVGAGGVKVEEGLTNIGNRKAGRGHVRGGNRRRRHRSECPANSESNYRFAPAQAWDSRCSRHWRTQAAGFSIYAIIPPP